MRGFKRAVSSNRAHTIWLSSLRYAAWWDSMFRRCVSGSKPWKYLSSQFTILVRSQCSREHSVEALAMTNPCVSICALPSTVGKPTATNFLTSQSLYCLMHGIASYAKLRCFFPLLCWAHQLLCPLLSVVAVLGRLLQGRLATSLLPPLKCFTQSLTRLAPMPDTYKSAKIDKKYLQQICFPLWEIKSQDACVKNTSFTAICRSGLWITTDEHALNLNVRFTEDSYNYRP